MKTNDLRRLRHKVQTVLRIPVQPPDIRCRKAIADNGLCKPKTVRQIVQ